MGKAKRQNRQAGVIPFRIRKGDARFCVITTSRGRWGFPKGYIESGETEEEAALKEAYEEAGLKGSLVGPPLGNYETIKLGNGLDVVVYLMEVKDSAKSWPEEDSRDRKWVTASEASDMLAWDSQRELLKQAVKRIDKEAATNGSRG